MSLFENSYMSLLQRVLFGGVDRNDRTGVGTTACFAETIDHEWADGFPIITHRVLNPRPAFAEMSCFIKGQTDVRDFEAAGCRWWRANLEDWNKRHGCEGNTDLGPIYGYKWRNFNCFDQLQWLLNEAKVNPNSRRLLVTAWDPSDQDRAVLPPCHYSWQIFISEGKLDLLFTMRSVDIVLGMPADFAAYAWLQLALCRELGLEPRRLTGHFADTHVYKNHVSGAVDMLDAYVERALPAWKWSVEATCKDFYELGASDLVISKFEQGPSIKFEMAV